MKKDLGPMPRDYQLQDRLGFKLSRLSRIMQMRLETGLTKHGLTRMKWCVLSGVALEGHDSPSDLADHIGITRPATSRLLKQMIQEGLIERNLTEDDGRSRKINVTALGEEKLNTCWPMVEANQRHFLDKLGDDDRNTLNQLLHILIAGEEDAFDEL